MGLFDCIKGMLGRRAKVSASADRWNLEELARRLDIAPDELQNIKPTYSKFTIPKRSGGRRTILAPTPELKQLQRRILRRLLAKLRTHPGAMGFEKGRSIVTNARPHVQADIVIRMDIRDYFGSTPAQRINAFWRYIGWDKPSADILTNLCTYNGALPQGAPTSPRLSNLVNYGLDARLDKWAQHIGTMYTRYADDIVFSFSRVGISQTPLFKKWLSLQEAPVGALNDFLREAQASTIRLTKKILRDYGYKIHHHKKLSIRRKHQCQKVTGLVVNEKIALPRQTRRWLRAVEHHHATGKPSTLTPQQLQGWRALQYMVEQQTAADFT